ncbi:MAG: hypothetical protein WAK17_27090 [Candidatus Nitrosopolaris sp.]
MQDIQYDNLRLVVWFIVPALSIVLWYEKADNDFVWLIIALSMIAAGLMLRVLYISH